MDAAGLVAIYCCSPGSPLWHWCSQVSRFSTLFSVPSLKWATPRTQCEGDPATPRLWWACRTNKWDGLFWPSAFDWKGLVIKTLRQSSCALYLMAVKGRCVKGGRNSSCWCIGRRAGWLFRAPKWEAECFRHVLKEMDVEHQMWR